MRVSLSWLKQLVDIDVSTDELVSRLIDTGTEVEAVETAGEALNHVVVGYVLTCEEHPNSDHLHVCTVDVGPVGGAGSKPAAPLTIVCGAPNVAAGQKVPVACVGAQLPGDFKIKKSKLRGVESNGMICSARELGLGQDHDGIMVLDQAAPLGQNIAEYLGISDTVLVCEITPNRPDCLSMRGFAKEVSAILGTPLHLAFQSPRNPHPGQSAQVDVEDPTTCPRYVARVIHNVQIGPSPAWLTQTLEAAGVRSINNVVDISNYVMLLTGQPLHTFDFDTYSHDEEGKAHVVVRRAHASEKIQTLDGIERTLAPDMLLITDGGKKPMALAGVMGGLDSEISDATTSVLLESAVFAPGMISKTSRDLQLVSEASLRYERGVDRTFCDTAADLACALLEELAGGEVESGVTDVYSEPYEAPTITLRYQRVRDITGAPITDDFMMAALTSLGCTCENASSKDATATVTPPPTRPDLTRECDLTEEILRLWGMNQVTATIPKGTNVAGKRTLEQLRAQTIAQKLIAFGASEAQTYCFAENTDKELLGNPDLPAPVELINPLTQDMRTMRRLMLPGLMRALQYNVARNITDVALFEQGRVFYANQESPENQPKEPCHLGFVLTGNRTPRAWNEHERAVDFYDAKAAIETITEALKIPKLRYKEADPATYPWLQPGKAALVYSKKTLLGWVGAVHPNACAAFAVTQEVIAAELDQDALLALAEPLQKSAIKPTQDQPAIKIDLALVVPDELDYTTIYQRITSAGGKYLESAVLFDVYTDATRVGEGKKSLAFTLTFRAPDRSLTSEEVAASVEKLTQKLERGLNAQVRAG